MARLQVNSFDVNNNSSLRVILYKQAGTDPSQRPLQFLKYAKGTVFEFSTISQCPKLPQRNAHKTREPLFPRQETQKIHF